MIKISNIKKQYGKQTIFNDLSYEFPPKGMIAICGPSGCGKSTLLNILSGLLPPDSGKVIHEKTDLYSLNDDKLSIYRLRHFGFVFQDFKLFETETVFHNITLPLDSLSKVSKRTKERKVSDLLSLVHLTDKIHQNVNLLSGGEKQRVAIARAIVNNPNIIFADEPTGALDEKNANEVMEILRKLSTHILVIVVSHDVPLVKEYAHQIIYMLDGKITDIETIKEVETKENLPIVLERRNIKKVSIPIPFLLHHSYFKMKEKKWRMLMCDMVMSLSLIGAGASISLTSSISSNIKKAYGDILGEDRICVDKKSEVIKNYGVYSVDKDEAEMIMEEMNDDVNDIGVTYYIDYESFFTNKEQVTFSREFGRSFYVGGLSFRDFNDYVWLEDINTSMVYPNPVRYLGDNEVILGLDIQMMREICYGLQIERTVLSLNNYLNSNRLIMHLDVENYDWTYSKGIEFEVKGYILEKESKIYHSKHDWNETVFERMLELPPSNYISGYYRYPWEVRKIYYLKTFGNTERFLEKTFANPDFYEYIFEIANQTYYPNLFKNTPIDEIDRLLIFKDYRNGIDVNLSPYILNECKHLSNPIYATYGGYAIYPSAFLSGFARPTYFSSSLDVLDDAIDSLSSFASDINQIEKLPNGVYGGYFANPSGDNIIFSPWDNDKNTKDLKLHEVIISQGLAKALFKTVNPINQEIYLTFNIRDVPLSNDRVRREFNNTVLVVKGVSNENKFAIHHRSEWGVLFFQCKLGVSIFSLSVYSISYEVDDKSNLSSSIEHGNKHFSELEFYNPMEDFNLGVDEVCHFIEIALLIFSLVSVIVSIMLLSTCAYLHVIENKKDIGLARCLGLPKLEASKFIFTYTFVTSLISFVLSSVELLGFTFFSMYTISNVLGSSSVFTFNPLSLLMMFGLTFFVALFSSVIFSYKITKMNPLESIK
ncbi:MAG: ATP-binding cassette domain-containing protein [Bacilli bacterium]|nr:ATP-binding cassette domain-containing protein [Bacilli bacterium]